MLAPRLTTLFQPLRLLDSLSHPIHPTPLRRSQFQQESALEGETQSLSQVISATPFLLTQRPRAESSQSWSSNALTLNAQPAQHTTPPPFEASALPASLTTRSLTRGVKSSAEMALKTELKNVMTETQTAGMDVHPFVNRKLTIFAQDGPQFALFRLSAGMEKRLQQSNVMTPIQVQVTDATQLVSSNTGFTGTLLLTQFTPFVMIL